MRHTLNVISMAMHEAIFPPTLARRPEPSAAMDEADNIAAFHQEGARVLVPVYHFNALAISRLVPKGGVVIDLGSGSGQFLVYLSIHRPDIHIIGLDLSPGMIRLGSDIIKEQGMADRIELRLGDMTRFEAHVPAGVSLISSIFSLHHLPGLHELDRCLRECARMSKAHDCGLWIFDHARPRRRRTADLFPRIFSSAAAPAFQEDSTNSLIASYRYDELIGALTAAGIEGVHHYVARYLPLYQAHWLEISRLDRHLPLSCWHHGTPLPPAAQRQFQGLRRIMKGVPLDRGGVADGRA